jgi:hypothetical protein
MYRMLTFDVKGATGLVVVKGCASYIQVVGMLLDIAYWSAITLLSPIVVRTE